VSKWISEAGNGQETIMLMVLNSGDRPPTKKDFDDDIRLGEKSGIRKALKEEGKILTLKAFSQENAAGYIFEAELELDRAGLEFTVRQRQFVLFVKSRAVMLSCQVGALREDAKLVEAKMSRFSELCRRVVNSLVLPQQYVGGK
jgi:hypothetical protein